MISLLKMGVAKDLMYLILQYMILSVCECFELPSCNVNELNSCGTMAGIECNASTKKCECSIGYEFHPDNPDNPCVLKIIPDSNSDSGSSTTSVVMVVFLTLLLLGSALFFIVRRYNLLHWVHNKIFSNRNTGAAYEDVMIGQDDPPITA